MTALLNRTKNVLRWIKFLKLKICLEFFFFSNVFLKIWLLKIITFCLFLLFKELKFFIFKIEKWYSGNKYSPLIKKDSLCFKKLKTTFLENFLEKIFTINRALLFAQIILYSLPSILKLKSAALPKRLENNCLFSSLEKNINDPISLSDTTLFFFF